MNTIAPSPSSYRDPSGFVFEKEGVIYRQVNLFYREHYDLLTGSGAYEKFSREGWLLPHGTVSGNLTGSPDYYLTLQPEKIAFISYPYEWCFSRLRDAALLTLRLAREALDFGLVLKDATPYNIQWHQGKQVFIDTLSFEKYEEKPWIAYRQFCESFLAPLVLMHYSKRQLPELLLAWPDGIPIDIAASLLPRRSRFNLYTWLHIHLHARLAKKQGNKKNPQSLPKQKFINLLSSLESLVSGLRVPEQQSTWSNYYEEAATRNDYLEQKKRIIAGWLDARPALRTALDAGANEGAFSQLLAQRDIQVIAADLDPYCIDRLYTSIRTKGEKNIQPLVIDLSHPSPAIGVNNQERSSFTERSSADIVMALALIHHLAIGKNIPLAMAASFFQQLGPLLIIEFVPKEDEKVSGMLQNKKDIYEHYHQQGFEEAFSGYFRIVDRQTVAGTHRTLYLMQRHG